MAEKLQRRSQQAAVRAGMDRLGTGLLGKLFSLRIGDHRQVAVVGNRHSQASRQPDLTWCGVKQVDPAHYGADTLRSIVHHHRQLVGELTVGAEQNKVADRLGEILSNHPLNAIREANFCRRDAHSPSTCGPPRGQTRAACSGVEQPTVHRTSRCTGTDFPSRAGTGVDVTAGLQALQCGMVYILPLALNQHLTVPFKGECLQRPQDLVRCAWLRSLPVDVFDAQQPLTAMSARIKIAAERSDQRTEVQRTGRRRREATAIGSAGAVTRWFRSVH